MKTTTARATTTPTRRTATVTATAMVRATLGADPEVVSGDEEARLSYTGAVRGLDAPAPYLVVDIGGGSTEFVTGSSAAGPSAAWRA